MVSSKVIFLLKKVFLPDGFPFLEPRLVHSSGENVTGNDSLTSYLYRCDTGSWRCDSHPFDKSFGSFATIVQTGVFQSGSQA